MRWPLLQTLRPLLASSPSMAASSVPPRCIRGFAAAADGAAAAPPATPVTAEGFDAFFNEVKAAFEDSKRLTPELLETLKATCDAQSLTPQQYVALLKDFVYSTKGVIPALRHIVPVVAEAAAQDISIFTTDELVTALWSLRRVYEVLAPNASNTSNASFPTAPSAADHKGSNDAPRRNAKKPMKIPNERQITSLNDAIVAELFQRLTAGHDGTGTALSPKEVSSMAEAVMASDKVEIRRKWLEVAQRHLTQQQFSLFDLGHCWSAIARANREGASLTEMLPEEFLSSLAEAVAATLEKGQEEVPPVTLAQLLWSAGRLRFGHPAMMQQLYAKAMEYMEAKLYYSVSWVSLLPWVMAQTGVPDKTLYTRCIERLSKALPGSSIEQPNLVMLAWGMRYMAETAPEVRTKPVIKALVAATMASSTPPLATTLANLLWLCASVGERQPNFLAAAAEWVEAHAGADAFMPADLDHVTWAASKLNMRNVAMYKAVLGSLARQMKQQTHKTAPSMYIATAVWRACLIAGVRRSKALEAVELAILDRMRERPLPDHRLTPMYSTIAANGRFHSKLAPPLRAALAAKLDSGTLDAYELSNLATAFARMKEEDTDFVELLRREILRTLPTNTFSLHQLSMVAAAFNSLNRDKSMINALAPHVVQLLQREERPQVSGLTMLLRTFVFYRSAQPQVYEALLDATKQSLSKERYDSASLVGVALALSVSRNTDEAVTDPLLQQLIPLVRSKDMSPFHTRMALRCFSTLGIRNPELRKEFAAAVNERWKDGYWNDIDSMEVATSLQKVEQMSLMLDGAGGSHGAAAAGN